MNTEILLTKDHQEALLKEIFIDAANISREETIELETRSSCSGSCAGPNGCKAIA